MRSIVGVITLFLSTTLAASWPAIADDPPAARLFEGIGSHTRTVTTKHPEAQQFFNQGLNYLFAFNHDEAIRLFEQTARLDPQCAMAYWGVAFANGPHINNPVMPPDRCKAAWAALLKAKELAGSCTHIEKGLIEALGQRYAETTPEDRRPLDVAF